MTKQKIILITNDTLLAASYRARLIREGLDVEVAFIGQHGLFKARRNNPSLIVLDLTLPGLSGLDVLKCLRDVPWLTKVHVVLLIEKVLNRDALNECLIWGGDSYLYKDACSVAEFAEHVRKVLPESSPVPTH